MRRIAGILGAVMVLAVTSGAAAEDLIGKARQYLGRSGPALGLPATLWCSDFLNFITGGGTHSRMADSWLRHPRIAPQPGVVAVIGYRGRVTHVGLVTGLTPRGDPIIISGNHNRRVGESVYSRASIVAFVSAY